MKAAVLHAPKDIRFEEVKTPRPGKGEVLIKVKAAGICGSDIPRVMETGTYHFPTIPGHEFGGEVVELGKGVPAGIKPGQNVAVVPCIPCGKCFWCKKGEYFQCENYNYLGSRCDGGFAEFVKVPAGNLVKAPAKLDDELPAFVEPAVVAEHCLWRAGGIKPGQSVAVFGLGPIGNLVAQWAKASKAGRIFGIDIDENKIAIARKTGIKDLFNAKETDPIKSILGITDNKGVDLAVEAAGSSRALENCFKAVRKLGRVALVGRIENEVRMSPETYALILRKELVLTGSWGYRFNNFKYAEWYNTLNAMKKGELNVKPLITHRFPLSKAREVFEMLYLKKEPYMKVLFKP
ncbi:MAG: galactitol-1-phosphate 5-dehydrogenase [Candidatus Omnitrophica bacterium]|nr:galactitol-1-phosphate 5-dehydrogenase [Candidatus Omnitrophota bacterium]